MKRTRDIRKDRIRKQWKGASLTVVFGGALFLTGCDRPSDSVYGSVSQCILQSNLSGDQCRAAFNQAVTDAQGSGKRYYNRQDCLRENPDNDCPYYSGSSGSHYYAYPHYFGYNRSTGTGSAYFAKPGSKDFRSSSGKPFIRTRGGFGSTIRSHASFGG